MVARVNAISTIVSVQFVFGQFGAPAMGEGGGFDVTINAALPLLIALAFALAGIATLPVTVTGAGFCPGAELLPLLVQTAIGFAVAERFTSTSPNPSPASVPAAVRVRPLSVKTGAAFGPPFTWTLFANSVKTANPRLSQPATGAPLSLA